MQVAPTSNDWAAMLAATPDIPQNQQIRAHLAAMVAQAKAELVQYWYTLKFAAIATGAAVPLSVQVDGSGDFECDEIIYAADLAGAARTFNSLIVPNVTILIVDQSSNRQWMNAALPLEEIAGNAFFRRKLDEPHVIRANGGFNVTLTSYEAVNTPNVYVGFGGKRIYPMGQQQA